MAHGGAVCASVGIAARSPVLAVRGAGHGVGLRRERALGVGMFEAARSRRAVEGAVEARARRQAARAAGPVPAAGAEVKTEAAFVVPAEEKEEEEDRGARRRGWRGDDGVGVVDGCRCCGDGLARGGGDERARREEIKATPVTSLAHLVSAHDGVARVRMGRREVRAAVMLKDALEEVWRIDRAGARRPRRRSEHVRQAGTRRGGNDVRGEFGGRRASWPSRWSPWARPP